jgi:hypothetical protein
VVAWAHPTVRVHRAFKLGQRGLTARSAAPAYLEASKPDLVPYYSRFGFEVTGEIKLPDGGPPMFPMWRNPR